tara:strand:+ start:44 stop:256 length:213 start_codon:yes stop_codon:yes gene_type:complete
MDIQQQLKQSKLTSLFNIHHKIKLQLDEVCQDKTDMNLKEFLKVYEDLKKETTIDRNFQEDMIDNMDMGQ